MKLKTKARADAMILVQENEIEELKNKIFLGQEREDLLRTEVIRCRAVIDGMEKALKIVTGAK